jgi:hypothetical protein
VDRANAVVLDARAGRRSTGEALGDRDAEAIVAEKQVADAGDEDVQSSSTSSVR